MKQIAYITTVLFSVMFMLYACVKDKAEDMDEETITFDEIDVPADFDFSTTKEVTITITIENPEVLTNYRYVIKIYDKAPDEGGKLLVTGAADTETYTFSRIINLPSNAGQVWTEIKLGAMVIQQGYRNI